MSQQNRLKIAVKKMNALDRDREETLSKQAADCVEKIQAVEKDRDERLSKQAGKYDEKN